jgi:hypothetical protein
MFVDDRHNQGPAEGHERGTPRGSRSDGAPQPLADREVPLDRHGALSAAVHAWLDGELPEAAVRKGDTTKDVEFWQMIGQETSRMRQTRTPAHVEALIMDALPQTAPLPITPWYRREFIVTPAVALGAAAVLVAVTAAVTALLLTVAP